MKKAICILILSAFLGSPLMADYGDVKVEYSTVAPGLWLQIDASKFGSTVSARAGIYQLTLTDLSVSPSSPYPEATLSQYFANPVSSFCVDIWDTVPSPDAQWYDIMPLAEVPDPMSSGSAGMGPLRASYVTQLLNTYWDLDNWADPATLQFDVQTADEMAASVQAAIWEIVDEYDRLQTTPPPGGWDWDVTRGVFQVHGFDASTNRVVSAANQILNSLDSLVPVYPYSYVGLSNPIKMDNLEYQDYIVRVPVPAAVLLGFLGLGAAGLKLRKFA